MKLIGTDVVIDHFHGHEPAMAYFAAALAAGEELAISVVTVTELTGGMRPDEEAKTEPLLELFTVINVTEPIGRQAGSYLRQFHRSHNVELGDALIAATAAQAGADLVTRNPKHYPMPDINITPPYDRGRR